MVEPVEDWAAAWPPSAAFAMVSAAALTAGVTDVAATTVWNSQHLTVTTHATAGQQHTVGQQHVVGHGVQHADVAVLVHCAVVVAGHAVVVAAHEDVAQLVEAHCAETTVVIENARAIMMTNRETTTFFMFHLLFVALT